MDVVNLKPGMRVRYVGPGAGCGAIHVITSVSPDGVTTWGDWDSSRNNGKGEGDSWMGPLPSFLKQFRPAASY